PVVGDLAATPRLDVLVEAVPGDVELAIGEPGAVRWVPLERLRGLLHPGDELVGETGPEAFEVVLGPAIDLVVRDDRVRAELLGGRKGPRLVEQRLDRGLRVLRFHVRRNMTDSKGT